jgi:hypothetical protein
VHGKVNPCASVCCIDSGWIKKSPLERIRIAESKAIIMMATNLDFIAYRTQLFNEKMVGIISL